MVDQIFLLVVSESVRAQYHHVIIITVDECLNRLFSAQFCPGVSVGTRVPQQLSCE